MLLLQYIHYYQEYFMLMMLAADRLKEGDKVTRYYLDGGFVQVVDDVVSVLTNRAMLAGEVDAEVAQQQLDGAFSQSIATAEFEEIRDRTIAQARAQIRVSKRV